MMEVHDSRPADSSWQMKKISNFFELSKRLHWGAAAIERSEKHLAGDFVAYIVVSFNVIQNYLYTVKRTL